ncbi:AAA family ATPase [Phormidium sp. CLA17]|uniref:AAA family ATPase n=1 Tax=Leptolyngbya sp. Cla-17 TaxID=2803751 RepID=UPI0014931609|nr:AAA family ATPase [Leptolyngbya sp. Cla-17]MBM0741660.1 AAA family ATPase [Leptolyngbya sp. Cla-17]
MDIEPFFDNWCYLRIELGWLDRVLATAVARQRKDTKEIEHVARSQSDRVTSHWWKGIVCLEGTISSDSPADMPRKGGSGLSYQQQMEAKIRVSQQHEVALGLPTLCQRLSLTPFEKNVVLMALAPEVSRRYGKLYNFLQDANQSKASGLPTVDLLLRLLCRNDGEWRSARLAFAANATLVQRDILRLPTSSTEPFLDHPIKLVDPIVEYLLADQPDVTLLDRWLQKTAAFPIKSPLPALKLDTWEPENLKISGVDTQAALQITPAVESSLWFTLRLPEPLLASLRHLGDRIQYAQHVDEQWGFQSAHENDRGSVVLFVGDKGTGKTLAAQAIAQQLQMSLMSIDLSCFNLTEQRQLLADLTTEAPTVLLLKSAECWLGKDAVLAAELQSFLVARHRAIALTIFSTERKELVKPSWQRQMSQILTFPKPNYSNRFALWQQAFPAQVSLAYDVDWNALARLCLSAGEIQVIAREAAICAAANGSVSIAMVHLRQACRFKGIKL